MMDVAENNGHHIDDRKLAEALGVPVLPMVASTGAGRAGAARENHRDRFKRHTEIKPQLFCQLPGLFRIEATGLAGLLAETFRNGGCRRPRRRC